MKEPVRVAFLCTKFDEENTTTIICCAISSGRQYHERFEALCKKFDNVELVASADNFVYYMSDSDFGIRR